MSVVAGHVFDSHYFYMYHMPLFFFIAGYTFRANPNNMEFFVKKTLRLGLPYICFMMLLLAFQGYVFGYRENVSNLLYGGSHLRGIYGIYWFVPVMYFSLLALNMIKCRLTSNVGLCMATCGTLLLAYLIQYIELDLPLSMQNIPFALSFMLVGNLCAMNQANSEVDIRSGKIIGFVLSATGIGMLVAGIFIYNDICIDMKYSDYGIPILSFVAALSIIIALIGFSKYISDTRFIALPFVIMGECSMTIMYIHQFINIVGTDYNKVVIILLCIIVPVVMDVLLISRYRITRLLFQGINDYVVAKEI